MYNRTILIGRIANDLELKQTNSGKAYCKFNLAVNRMNDGTDFIPITVWNKQAENLVQYQNKGSLILVDGAISMSNYTDQNGNNRTSFDVMAQNVQFLGNKKTDANIGDNSTEENDLFAEYGETVEIDDGFLD